MKRMVVERRRAKGREKGNDSVWGDSGINWVGEATVAPPSVSCGQHQVPAESRNRSLRKPRRETQAASTSDGGDERAETDSA